MHVSVLWNKFNWGGRWRTATKGMVFVLCLGGCPTTTTTTFIILKMHPPDLVLFRVLKPNVTRKSKRLKLLLFCKLLVLCFLQESQRTFEGIGSKLFFKFMQRWATDFRVSFKIFFYCCFWREPSGYRLMDPALMCFELWLHWWIKHLNGFYQVLNVWKNTFCPTPFLQKKRRALWFSYLFSLCSILDC